MLAAGAAESLFGRDLERDYSLAELLRRPGVSFDDVVGAMPAGLPESLPNGVVSRETIRAEMGGWLADSVIEQLQIELKYAGYVERQVAATQRMKGVEDTPIPADFDYSVIQALSHEARQVLTRRQPQTVGEAARLPGVTPASIAVLQVFLKRGRTRAAMSPARSLA